MRWSGAPGGIRRVAPLGGVWSGGVPSDPPGGGTRRMPPLGGGWSCGPGPPGGIRRSAPFGGPGRMVPFGGCRRTGPLGGTCRTGGPLGCCGRTDSFGGPGYGSVGGTRGVGPVSGTRSGAPGGFGSSAWAGRPAPRSQGAVGSRRRAGSFSAASARRGSSYPFIGPTGLCAGRVGYFCSLRSRLHLAGARFHRARGALCFFGSLRSRCLLSL
jgi:hypothetical protein